MKLTQSGVMVGLYWAQFGRRLVLLAREVLKSRWCTPNWYSKMGVPRIDYECPHPFLHIIKGKSARA